MRIDAERTKEVIEGALESGVNFFDTADMYANGRSEELLGPIPRRSPVAGHHRHEIRAGHAGTRSRCAAGVREASLRGEPPASANGLHRFVPAASAGFRCANRR